MEFQMTPTRHEPPESGSYRSAFAALGLHPSLLEAVAAEGYETPTPIQTQAIPQVLAARDVIGCAQTGTGKTAAFVLPLLQRLASTKPERAGAIRALVLAPTRELAAQIAERARAYGSRTRLRVALVYGGVGQRPQEEALARKPELLIATPGRLLDLMNQGFVSLAGVEIFVLDEADRMLDMGFLPDVRRVIAALPKKRQTLLFSATVPPAIADLADRILVNPAKVAVTPKVTAAETVDQSVYMVGRSDKRALLEQFLRAERPERVLVFARTKHGANRIAEHLAKAGISSAAIHGNKSQGARERALGGFKTGDLQVLVATDIAARGIDVDGVSHVVNYELPTVPETYVHRIGRTGRAGATGVAISYCDHEERQLLAQIERFLGKRLPVKGDPPPAEPAQPHAPRPPSREQPPAGGYRAKPRRAGGFRRR